MAFDKLLNKKTMGYFVISLLLVSSSNIFSLLFPATWSSNVINMYNYLNSSVTVLGFLWALVSGVILANYKIKDFDFNLKYLLGTFVLLLIIIFNFLIIICTSILFERNFNIVFPLKWFLLTFTILLAVYSISFSISLLMKKWVISMVLSVVAILLPRFIKALLVNILFFLKIIKPQDIMHKTIINITNHLSLPYYLGFDFPHRNLQDVNFLLDIPIIFLISVVIYYLIRRKAKVYFEN